MIRTRSWLASATAVAVTTVGLTLATPAQPALASTSLTVSPSAPIVNESFAATGRVSTRFARPVALKVYSAGVWRTVKAGWTTKYGSYRLAAPGVSKATAYKVVASAYKGRGQTLNRSNWDYRAEGQYIASRTRSKSDSTAVSVGGGTVNLMVKPDPRSSSRYLNGHISTERHYKFTHGLAAARVRFQQGRGSHGSFWLQSPTYSLRPGNPGLSGAEIDTVEFFGQGYPDGGLATFLYYANSSRTNVKYGDVWRNAYKLKSSSDTWWNSYHVFAVKWTPTSYTFYIDGQQLWSSARAVSQTDQFLILSLLSSDWELKYLDRAHLSTKSVMRVDWARVWTR